MKQVRSLATMAVGLAAAAGIDVRALVPGSTLASGAGTPLLVSQGSPRVRNTTSISSLSGTVTVKLGTGSSHKQNRRKQLLNRRK
jgi:hypothetical protein